MKIVYLDMVGDLFHWGHVEMFKEARQYGDLLYVGVHSDEDVESYKRKPILSMEERIAVIEACRYVDRVIPNAPLSITEEYLDEHKIDLVIHGHAEDDDYYERVMYAVPVSLGKFKRVEYHHGISTTEIIERVKSHP
jgi:cytidyltransferase-like protein